MYTPAYRQYLENVSSSGPGNDFDDLPSEERRILNFIIDLSLAVIETGYTTVMQTILPALLVLTGIAGFVLANRKQSPYPPPYPPGQQMPPYQQQPPPRY
jgi:hypothetical protein